jgi:hypothetical protein
VLSTETIEEVIQKLIGPIQVVDLKEAILRYIIVFRFSSAGDPCGLMRTEVTKMI